MNPSPAIQGVVRDLVVEAVERLHCGWFLLHGGCRQFTFAPGERLQLATGWREGRAGLPPLRVAAELRRHDGYVLRRVVSPALGDAPPEGLELNLGIAPSGPGKVADYIVRVKLEDAVGQGQVLDRIEQPIKILAPSASVIDEQWLAPIGPRLTLRKRPVFLLGLHYHPGAGPAGSESASRHWLDCARFDPAVVNRDLDRIRQVGINAVSITYRDERQAPQLAFFIHEAQRRGVWVYLALSHLDPLSPDFEKAEKMIQAAGLSSQPQVFALDVAWRPRLGHDKERTRLDGEWKTWLQQQYGSLAHARKAVGRPLWRRGQELTGPPDAELIDGRENRAVAVYRRFVDDMVSRRYGRIKRFLRRQGCRQLITARTDLSAVGSAETGAVFPLDPASGAVHMDMLTLSAQGAGMHRESTDQAGFLTSYARAVSDGKPVLWMDFGVSVGGNPGPVDLEHQAAFYGAVLDSSIRSHAAGCFGWCFASGAGEAPHLDCNLVHPDGTWRPVGKVFQEVAHRLRWERGLPQPWRGRTFDRFAGARGYSALWDDWRALLREEAQAGALEELRPLGHARLTTEMPLVGLDGNEWVPPAPLHCANAEWGGIKVDHVPRPREPGEAVRVRLRQTLDLELVNTGPATWSHAQDRRDLTVWVRCERSGRRPSLLKVPTVPFGKSQVVSWVAPEPGTWKLRPHLLSFGAFGEPLYVEVLPATGE
jgi:hypothetical protein